MTDMIDPAGTESRKARPTERRKAGRVTVVTDRARANLTYAAGKADTQSARDWYARRLKNLRAR